VQTRQSRGKFTAKVKKFHRTAEKQREDAFCILHTNAVLRKNERRETLNFLGFDENDKNTLSLFLNQGHFSIFS